MCRPLLFESRFMRETWYVLEDGNAVDPADVYHDGTCLRHKNGVAVAMRGEVPSSRSVDPDEERAKNKPEDAPKAKNKTEDAPKPSRGYKTRETRAD